MIQTTLAAALATVSLFGFAAGCSKTQEAAIEAPSAPVQAPTPVPNSTNVKPTAAADEVPTPAPNAPAPTQRPSLNPSGFEAVLQSHVRGGRVDYDGLKADAQAQGQLGMFVRSAAKMSDDDPLSSWLNVYNAIVIHEVLSRYPMKSVMDDDQFFKAVKHDVAGQRVSLDDIENKVIRARFKDARIHVALNCGAVSCPPLAAKAFAPATLDADLNTLSRAMVADPTHVELKGGKLHVSALFNWFKADFERDGGTVPGWIKKYAARGMLAEVNESTPLVEKPYDWALAVAEK